MFITWSNLSIVASPTALTEIWANKGDNVDVNYTATTDRFVNFCVATKPGILYFYVGDTAQNVNLINAGKLVDRL